jgi:quaternary ammonium compound-resistance protein SugE
MAWLFLLAAGLCEIAWAIGLKYTEGFSRLLPTIGTVAAMVASIGCLGLALKWTRNCSSRAGDERSAVPVCV